MIATTNRGYTIYCPLPYDFEMNSINISQRKLRVFVSSTFNDMAPERDYLSQYIFPRINDYCYERNVIFTPVDLRWGITQEENEAKETVALCLEEIDSSFPFFIGLAGGRYGWVPQADELSDRFKEIISRTPWIKEVLERGCSITELEFLYGALYRKDQDVKATFYVKELPQEECEPEQLRLRQSLNGQTRFPVKSYSTPKELGEQIFNDITAVVNQSFLPVSGNEEEIRRERHEFMLKKVLDEYIYLGQRDQEKGLEVDEWFNSSKKFGVIGGKWRIEYNKVVWRLKGTSVLLCRFVDRLRTVHRAQVEYFDMRLAGNEDRSAVEELVEFIANQGCNESGKERILALDNVSPDIDADRDILVQELLRVGPGVRIIMATFYYGWCKRLDYEHIYNPLEPNKEELDTFIVKYLKRFGKKLTVAQRDKIIEHFDELGSLTSMLRALVRFGDFNALDEEIKRYCMENIFECLLRNLKDSVGNMRQGNWEPMWILNAIGLSSSAGLSENEILQLTNIPMLRWSKIKPFIAELCQLSGNRYVLDSDDVLQILVLNYYTNFRDMIGARIKTWIAKENKISEARKAVILPNVYLRFYGAAESLCDEFRKERPTVFTDVDLVNRMSIGFLATGWRTTDISIDDLEKPWSLRQNQREYTTEELKTYYRRLISIPFRIRGGAEIKLAEYIACRLVELISASKLTDEVAVELVTIHLSRKCIDKAVALFSEYKFQTSNYELQCLELIVRYAFENSLFEPFLYWFDRLETILSKKSQMISDGDFIAMTFILEYDLFQMCIDLFKPEVLPCIDLSKLEVLQRKVKESNLLGRLEASWKHFQNRGFRDKNLEKVNRLMGYVNMFAGDYSLGMRNELDSAVRFAGNIHSVYSKEYARAMMDYGIGFMALKLEKNANGHVESSKLLSMEAEDLLNPWIILGLSTIMTDTHFKPELRQRAKELMDRISKWDGAKLVDE